MKYDLEMDLSLRAADMIEDGVLDNDEIIRLYTWLDSFKRLPKGPLFDLKEMLERICADSVVTSREREELLAFLKEIAPKHTSSQKGLAFEEFVITRFDNKAYRLIDWRSDKYIEGWGGPESSKWPDLVMEHIPTGCKFAIECKWRAKAMGAKFQWANPGQRENYIDYNQRTGVPVFIGIGIGGTPAAPHSLFIVNLERMNYADVSVHYLEKFRFPAHASGLDFG